MFVLAAAPAFAAEVHVRDRTTGQNTLLDINSTPRGKLPILFVHGHNLEIGSTESNDPNFQKNWQRSVNNLSSFADALSLPQNEWLDVEEYYIRFLNQGRSITEDAREISEAVEAILQRHDPAYNFPNNPTTDVQIVIIAYSKGTISTRLYLKDLETARPGFHPVSEFIAISPPNHGISFAFGSNCASRQLMNGHTPLCTGFLTTVDCSPFAGGFADFIENLNGHDIEDSEALDPGENYPSEAPGSRADTDQSGARNPPSSGALYVAIFADANRDLVGGDTPSNDCEGRQLALNLSSNAVNIPVASIPGGTDASLVHENTVHTPEVMCLALSAAAHHRSPKGLTCSQINGVPVIPRAAAMLTLDFSGSMSASACPTCGTSTRADVLKQAVELFIQLWSAMGASSDRLGVSYFNTNVTQFNLAGETLPLLSSASTQLITDVNGRTPTGSTAMGGGLQRSIEALNAVDNVPLRRVILFTDGMQNVNPMVRTVGNQLMIENEPARPNSNVTPTTPPIVLGPSLGIAVDTIGVGAGQSFVALLNDIASATGGHALQTTAIDNDLRQFFIEQLINALHGFSPQLVSYRHGSLARNGKTESFTIERGARKVVLKVSWKPGDSLNFSVAKDGVDVTSAGRVITGDFYKIFVIDTTAKNRIKDSGGTWQVRIKGRTGTAYEAAAIVDNGQLKYEAVFGAGRVTAGGPLDLTVRLRHAGTTIHKSARVTVTLLRPAKSAESIIATMPTRNLRDFEPGTTVIDRKHLAIAQDSKTWAALKPIRQTLVLRGNDKGEFRTRLQPTIPGIYTAIITINAENAKFGKFSRTITATTVVRSR